MKRYPRENPHGITSRVKLPEGLKIEDLEYRQQITIKVYCEERKAVVDLFVPWVWGGPLKAINYYDLTGRLYKTYIKIVWQETNGNWSESRFVRLATEAEFIAWRDEFDGDIPPTPMP